MVMPLKEMLARRVRAEVLSPTDAGYQDARKLFNGMIDKHPALIVRCTGDADVAACIGFAREQNWPVAVRGGGHNVAGNALCDGGLVIDLSAMKSASVDTGARRIRAGGGMTWKDFDQATVPHDLATTGGLISSTGIGGLTLGGGIGYFARTKGLACDNLTSVGMVTADGRSVRASESENADLFWGIRGGGGNFGVVTSLEYRLHPLGPLTGGLLGWPYPLSREVSKIYRECTASAPDELTLYASFLHNPEGMKVFGIIPFFVGDPAEAERRLLPLRSPIAPVLDAAGPASYPQLQTQLDAAYPSGMRQYWKSTFLKELPQEAFDLFAEHFADTPSPMCQIVVEQLGGAIAATGNDESAFDHRDSGYNLLIMSAWTDPGQDETCIRWARDLYEAARKWSSGGVYVNYMGTEDQPRIQEAYRPDKYARLAALKTKYDPDNLFRANMNVQPGGATAAGRP